MLCYIAEDTFQDRVKIPNQLTLIAQKEDYPGEPDLIISPLKEGLCLP